MKRYEICGNKKLNGLVEIQCAKNSVLPIMAGATMINDDVVIKNCPKIKDVYSMCDILNFLGAKVDFLGHDLVINCKNIENKFIPNKLTSELRSSIFLLGPLLSRFGSTKISYPGGCKIGKRPIDIHINGLKNLGANVSCDESIIFVSCGKINNKKIRLEFPSVGATENIIMASVFCQNEVIIDNCAMEPEIVDLCNFLNKSGAMIFGYGTRQIRICGVKRLFSVEYLPFIDRIELGTFLCLSMCSKGKIFFNEKVKKNIEEFSKYFSKNSCKVICSNDIIYINKKGCIAPFLLATGPYPLFPTDLQPLITSVFCLCKGEHIVKEKIFENRFAYANELKKMGADISLHGDSAFIKGKRCLRGADVFATDLRGGASLVIAGVCAEGKTTVYGIEHIERGYEDFDLKLSRLGADIKKFN